MHLQRIQVPDFRVLKDVDITFEKEFVPRIFPLGSLNGGGKSTLLQLIFVLLHCSSDPERKPFLKNLLQGFKIHEGEDKRVLAIIDLWDRDKSIQLEFFAYRDFYIRNLLDDNDITKPQNDILLRFSLLEQIEQINKYYQYIQKLKDLNDQLETINQLKDLDQINHLMQLMNLSDLDLEGVTKKIKEELEVSTATIEVWIDELKKHEPTLNNISNYLNSQNLIYICNYTDSEDNNENEGEVLLCHIHGIETIQSQSFLEELSQKIFLAAPATQIFLFLSKLSRKSLFRNEDNEKNYYSYLQQAQSQLPGFFAYDFLAIDFIIESFKVARDRDFIKAIETGDYGDSYKALLHDLHVMLVNKKINITSDFSGVNFKLDKDGETIQLYPEDLSHGELKRLSIYMWIKYRNIENAIVLMDEIEIAFHPDWQYQIISDLKEWGATNQYILATHSYELCQALTPAHVKEIEPKLIKPEAQN